MINLFKALIKAQSIAGSVEKTSKNDFHKYRYASAEAIIVEARAALVEAGLALVCVGWWHKEDRLLVEYELLHESGETKSFNCSSPIVVEKGRPQDKAEAAALTYNLGYFLRGLLLLPRVDERDEVDQRDDRNHDPLLHLKLELSTLLNDLGDPEMGPKVLKRIDKKGGGASDFASAIRYVRGLISANGANQVLDALSGTAPNVNNNIP